MTFDIQKGSVYGLHFRLGRDEERRESYSGLFIKGYCLFLFYKSSKGFACCICNKNLKTIN